MKHQFLASLGLLTGMIGALSLSPMPVSGQASTTVTKAKPTDPAVKWMPPRMFMGFPDLAGIWNNAVTTPMERLTEQETAARKQLQPDAVRRRLVSDTGPPAG